MSRGVAGLPRRITAAGLVVLAAISWALLAKSSAVMSAMEGDGLFLDAALVMMRPEPALPHLAVTTIMWMVMMIAMMAPAVLPATLVFQRLERKEASESGFADGALFAGGYLLVWLVFAVAATLLQWILHRAALLHAHLMTVGPPLTAAILLVAGLYQLTPQKQVCLRHCQTPAAFLLSHWEDGRAGALRMGMRHGLYCLGCCWALMLLMFVGGVMSVATMAVLSLFIVAERLLPPGPWTATLPGLVLIAWGAWTLVRLAL